MADEKYYKVAESDLVAIANVIRLQKGSEKKYTLKDMPKVIGAMLVLPSGLAETGTSMSVESDATGILPIIYKGVATSNGNLTVNPTANGFIPDYEESIANSVASISVNTSAVGILTEE